ncbi:hypothetical protein [Sagittula sp. SSi028]|uniref:hypothetical protein n=1 Tax=Sagittula sp. SSi028 TaxID=3400636 RepID=UPI003AF78FF7
MADRPRRCAADPRGTPLGRLNLQPSELVVLTVARHYFGSFAEPHRHGWLGAVTAALKFYGDDTGPHAAFAVLSAVQAMRRARVSAFRFNSADCSDCAAHISDNERQFLNTCRAMAQGRIDAAEGHALILCEGNDVQPFLSAAAILIEVCQLRPGADHPTPPVTARRSKARPRVRVVDVPPHAGL